MYCIILLIVRAGEIEYFQCSMKWTGYNHDIFKNLAIGENHKTYAGISQTDQQGFKKVLM